jgi:hypothetical protein
MEEKEILESVKRANLMRPLCKHLVGEEHGFIHHAIAGVSVMVVGVLIAEYSAHVDTEVAHVAGDAVGYALHGIGLVPFVERLLAEAIE